MSDQSVVCFEANNWGEAYKSLDLLLQNSCKVLEFGRISNGKVVILAETKAAIPPFATDCSLEDLQPGLLEAYFKLTTHKIGRSLCILENPSLLKVFQGANDLVKNHGFLPIEIYRACNGYQQAWALLANGTDPGKPTIEECRVHYFENLSPELLSFLS